jgi:hypothetical protein
MKSQEEEIWKTIFLQIIFFVICIFLIVYMYNLKKLCKFSYVFDQNLFFRPANYYKCKFEIKKGKFKDDPLKIKKMWAYKYSVYLSVSSWFSCNKFNVIW